MLAAEPAMQPDAAGYPAEFPVYALSHVHAEVGSSTGAAPCPWASCQAGQHFQRAFCAALVRDAGLSPVVGAGPGAHGLTRPQGCWLEGL